MSKKKVLGIAFRVGALSVLPLSVGMLGACASTQVNPTFSPPLGRSARSATILIHTTNNNTSVSLFSRADCPRPTVTPVAFIANQKDVVRTMIAADKILYLIIGDTGTGTIGGGGCTTSVSFRAAAKLQYDVDFVHDKAGCTINVLRRESTRDSATPEQTVDRFTGINVYALTPAGMCPFEPK